MSGQAVIHFVQSFSLILLNITFYFKNSIELTSAKKKVTGHWIRPMAWPVKQIQFLCNSWNVSFIQLKNMWHYKTNSPKAFNLKWNLTQMKDQFWDSSNVMPMQWTIWKFIRSYNYLCSYPMSQQYTDPAGREKPFPVTSHDCNWGT